MLTKTIKIGNLFKALNINNNKFYEVQTVNEEIYIETPSGYKPIRGYVIKNDIPTVKAYIGNKILIGADKHLVKIDNEWRTLDSFKHEFIGNRNCYDIAVDEPHEYLTANGIINHNTSIAKAIIHDLNADYIYINASCENSIDVIRTTIADFAQTMSFTGGTKIVILDEADGLTPQFQKALRGFIEEFESNCRFIITCNYLSKIIPALRQGRTMCFDFNMAKYKSELIPQIVARLKGILQVEGIESDDSVLPSIAEKFFPSIRECIATLQQYANTHGKIDSNILEYQDIGDELTNLLIDRKLTAARAFVEQHGMSYTDVFKNLFDVFVNNAQCVKKGQAIVLLADYEYRCSFSSDPSLQIAACMYELFGTLKPKA